MQSLVPWFVENLVDPVYESPRLVDGTSLVSRSGRAYPVICGVPVLLLPGERQSMVIAEASIQRSCGDRDVIEERAEGMYRETLDIFHEKRRELIELHKSGTSTIDTARMSTECQFGADWQRSDNNLMADKHKTVLPAFETLGRISGVLPPMRGIVDSPFSEATKPV